MSYLSNFTIIKPKFEKNQKDALHWIAEAHRKADPSQENFHERLAKVACKPGIIEKRGHEIFDFQHLNWNEMHVYDLEKHAKGASLAVRQKIHQEIVENLFLRFYELENCPPDNMIHVTCTGYSSPSGAQIAVSKKGWQKQTQVTHLYHMGCYAAVSALKVADGLCSKRSNTADVIHTELCTLHNHPELHDAAQLVVQSLFADGFIKYRVSRAPPKNLPHYLLEDFYEEIIPNSLEFMKWSLSDSGFHFDLGKEIPIAIANHIKPFVEEMFRRTTLSKQERSEAYFAVHPGGPKILDYVQKWLSLSDEQLFDSREILKNYGNMSSATLPHIWERMLQNDEVKVVVSLAFGPGLTLAGAILKKGKLLCG